MYPSTGPHQAWGGGSALPVQVPDLPPEAFIMQCAPGEIGDRDLGTTLWGGMKPMCPTSLSHVPHGQDLTPAVGHAQPDCLGQLLENTHR